jgi:hypothetical protein
MENRDGKIHLTPTEARAGSTPHVVRYVLGISMTLVILAFLLVWAVITGRM